MRSPFVTSTAHPGADQGRASHAAGRTEDVLFAESTLLQIDEAGESQPPAKTSGLQGRELHERDALFRSLVEAHGARLHRFIIKTIIRI